MFALAEILGKTVSEIEEISLTEWHYWNMYFQVKKDKEKSRSSSVNKAARGK